MSAVSEFLSFLLSTREGGGGWHKDSWERRFKAVCEKKLVALPFWMQETVGTVCGHHSDSTPRPPFPLKAFTAGTPCEEKD